MTPETGRISPGLFHWENAVTKWERFIVENFKNIWWGIILILFSLLTRSIWWPILIGKDISSIENGALLLFLIWTALLFWPIIEEINLFGLLNFKKEIKKEIESVKEKVGEINLTVSLGTPPYTYGEASTPKKILY